MSIASALRPLVEALKSRSVTQALVLTGPSRRFVDALQDNLPSVTLDVFDEVRGGASGEMVRAARARLDAGGAGAIIALGGGTVVGFGKALRREVEVPLFALPTTYAGVAASARIEVGFRTAGQPEHDPRTQPDATFPATALLDGLSPCFEIQDLMRALAGPVGALALGGMESDAEAEALRAVERLVGAMHALAESPGYSGARAEAMRGAALAAELWARAKESLHGRTARWVREVCAPPHAALHAALVPHTLRALFDDNPDVYAKIEAASGTPDLPGQLFDLLRRVSAPTMLVQLGLPENAIESAPEASKRILQSAKYGRRPTSRARHEDWGLPEPVTMDGGALADAHTVVLALPGRHASAESAVARARAAVGSSKDVVVVALQPDGRAWYENAYRKPVDTNRDRLEASLDALEGAVSKIRSRAPRVRLTIHAFSQGACTACELIARRGRLVDALALFAAARLGPRDAHTAPVEPLDGLPVLIAGAHDDSRIRAPDVEATARWFEAHGAHVEHFVEPGHAHRVSARHRLRARAVLLGTPAEPGPRGFGSVHEAEAMQGALPRRGNSPRRVRYGLFAEQINATGFVARREQNRRAWLYRVRPSAQHRPFVPLAHETFCGPLASTKVEPNLAGWAPLGIPDAPTDFVDGLATFGVGGDPTLRRGFAVHVYAANRSMEDRAFYDADGDLLLVPEFGALTLLTEQGFLRVDPGKIALVPRGLKFSVLLEGEAARGYVAEAYGRHFELPERGPVGANGLTEARHFVAPSPWHEDRLQPGFRITAKVGGGLFEATQDYSPFDVVAWHGNYSPYVYDLLDFCPVSNVRFDHPDPSIYTVLSAPMDELGAHSLDFVFFPPRWDVTEDTFRPPFFHRNATTEINGIIRMPGGGGPVFRPGQLFTTPSMTPHGVLAPAVQRVFAQQDDPPPDRMTEASMWFQFETALPLTLTTWAENAPHRIRDWPKRWGSYRTHFDPAG